MACGNAPDPHRFGSTPFPGEWRDCAPWSLLASFAVRRDANFVSGGRGDCTAIRTKKNPAGEAGVCAGGNATRSDKLKTHVLLSNFIAKAKCLRIEGLLTQELLNMEEGVPRLPFPVEKCSPIWTLSLRFQSVTDTILSDYDL